MSCPVINPIVIDIFFSVPSFTSIIKKKKIRGPYEKINHESIIEIDRIEIKTTLKNRDIQQIKLVYGCNIIK